MLMAQYSGTYMVSLEYQRREQIQFSHEGCEALKHLFLPSLFKGVSLYFSCML